MIARVQKDPKHYQFMESSQYSTWQAREVGKYIPALAQDDPEKRTLDEKRDNSSLSSADYNVAIELLLSKRNTQLAKFNTNVATLVTRTEEGKKKAPET